MSFLYRPTPVVNWGNGPYASSRVLSGWPGASMRGIPAGAGALGSGGPTGAVSRMRRVDTRMQPWLKSSGTMGSFIPNGLGQDDGSGIDWSTAGNISPDVPVFTPPDLTPPDLGLPDSFSPAFSPNLPALIAPSQPPLPASFFTNPSPIIPAPSSDVPVAPNFGPFAGAGPTGTGIPGTQPLNPASIISPAASIVSSIASFFPPKPAAPAGYRQLPGSGGSVAAASTSPLAWFSKSTILQGTPNYLTLLGGTAALLLVTSLFAGGKTGYRRR